MKSIKFILMLSLFITASVLSAQDANEIIRKVDRIMFPDARSEIILIFEKNKMKKDEYKFVSYSKDLNQKIIVRFTSPKNMAGNDLLFIDQNVWTYDKKAQRTVKIPSNLTFGTTGFSFGDVVRLNMTDNYAASVSSRDDAKWVLNLTSRERNAPYFRIELEVKKDGFIPVKGTCFGRNNNIIKTMEYSDIKTVNGIKKPVKITVKSPLEPDQVSTMILLNEALKEYPDRIFNKNNLELRIEEQF
jgi:hypothetical protein